MSGAWQRCLDAAGAVREGRRVIHFGDPRAETRAALATDAVFDLGHLGLIAARGADVVSFLQGQLTSDVRELSPQHSQLSAWLSPKGRVLVRMRLFRLGDTVYLELPREMLESTLRRLRMFVLRAQVTLDDASEDIARLGIVGAGAAAGVGGLLGCLPDDADGMLSCDDVAVIREHGPRTRYQMVGDEARLLEIWRAALASATLAGAPAWELLDIEAGIANVGPDLADQFLPQMLNLDRVGGVSFHKGCYVGQEIVARTHYLGRLKRRLYLAHASPAAAPRPGETLAGGGGESAGQIVNVQPGPEGGYHVLAVIPTDTARVAGAQPIHLADGTPLVLDPLPYALEDSKQ